MRFGGVRLFVRRGRYRLHLLGLGPGQLRRLRHHLRRRNNLPEQHVSAEQLCPQLPDQLVWWRRLRRHVRLPSRFFLHGRRFEHVRAM